MKRLLPFVLACLFGTAFLQAEEENADSTVRGVNPADNISKFEILPKFTMIDDGGDISISTMTLKYDKAFEGVYGLNFELPMSRFESPTDMESGIGDLNLRGRWQRQSNQLTFIAGVEAVVPSASDDTLGTGKFQTNPSVVAVHAFSHQTFIVAAAKHLFSIAGDAHRDDIVQGQYRLIWAHATERGRWFLADPQLWIDYNSDGRSHFAPEIEIGQMLDNNTGVWIRGGGHLMGDWKKDEWSISAGIRFITL